MSDIITIKYFKSPIGELIIGDYKSQICLCDWRYRKLRDKIDSRIKSELNAQYLEGSTQVIDECISQIQEYLSYKRKKFTIPILLIGTPFQKEVWNSLLEIPFGKTISYKKQAQNLNKEKAVRAIASANGLNAISIIVPCHRVIGSDGNLTGYAGGLSAKKKLLDIENDLFVQEGING
ncbi:MAG: methylated-DNA--[protein]-cysteine S-methyltransferase [Spirochaetales bacterium]|nr:methylated-DNA--[protein]-cysteine S-methyltransferase [Spirochaetales bacterium]